MAWRLGSDSRITAQAVERQMLNWELARSQRPRAVERQRPEVEDFLAISREVGVAAEEVAERVGERLGWPVLGRSLLDAMAGDDSIRQQIYRSMDQRDLKWWEGALYAIFVEDFGRNDYFRLLCETVLSLARQSCCVFVGRGCDRLLPSELGYRVRLIAPLEERIGRFARERGLERDAALREMDKITRARADFLRHHFSVDADDPTRHDLILNMGRLSTSEAAELIVGGRELRRRERAG